MASQDTFEVTVRGVGGHAAYPHQTADPIAAAAQIIGNLQHVISREVDPMRRAVVSVTRVAGGNTDNVIPEEVVLGGTVRTFEADVKAHVWEAIERIVVSVAQAHRCTAKTTFEAGYPPVVNHAEVAELVRRNVAPERLVEVEPGMGAEDFSAYQAVVPGCFFVVGGGGQEAFPHHHPRFAVDEEAIAVAIDVFVSSTLDFLAPRR